MKVYWTLFVTVCSLFFLAIAHTGQENKPTPPSLSCEDTDTVQNVQKKRETIKEITCECAAFNSKTPAQSDQPIISQKTIKINCTKEGEEKCAQLCNALAKASKDKGPEIVCTQLGHYKDLTVSMFSSTCKENKWSYTGLTSSELICCHENKVINCTSATKP